jgi:RNA polymerase sigma-B factor
VNSDQKPSAEQPTPGPGEGLASERALWARFVKDRDPAIREELVRRYLPFAKNLALRYRGASESFDDLLQVASLGLEVEKAISELTVGLQRSPSVSEIAERLECDPTDVLEVLEANHNRRPLSLDRPVGGEDSEESPASEWVGDEDSGYELVEDKLALEGALPHLDERERLVLQLRFVEDLTQSQIAERIGHSQMHVSRILRRTLERIRAEVAEQSAASSETE